jgi:DNA polymerase-3 subunit alpha
LCKNVDTRLVNKQVLESLTKSGAFDCWNRPRRQIFDSIPEALKIANNIQKEKSSNQMVLFDFGDDEEEQEDTSLESYLDVPEWSDSEKLKFEKETIGFFMSSHPLQHLHYITQKIATPIKELDPMDKSLKIIACIIVQSHVTQIKQGKSQGHKMAQLVVEDKTGNCKVTCFASAYEANPELYQEDKIIFIQGKQDVKQNDEVRLIVDKAYSLEEGLKLHTSIVNFNLGTQFSTEEDLLKLKNILIKYHGNCPIALVLNINSQEIQLQPAPEYNIDLSPDFFKEIEQSFDDSVITLVKRELEQKNTPYRRHSEYNKK